MRRILLSLWCLLIAAPAAAQSSAPVVEYYHLDALGSVRAVTDQNGTVVRRHDYFPFGEEYAAIPALDPVRFTGKERDRETGLDYFGARYYGSRIGRFTSVDPAHVGGNIFDPQSWNAYAYARNNPFRFVDPSGTEYQINWLNEGGWSTSYVSDAAWESRLGDLGWGYHVSGNTIVAWVDGRWQTAGWFTHVGPDRPHRFDEMIRVAGDQASARLQEYLIEMTAHASTAGFFASVRIAAFAIPRVTNQRLGYIINDLYKGVQGASTPIGRGTTADALRSELVSGRVTHGKFHGEKARQYVAALTNWLKANPGASRSDRAVAAEVLRDLKSALHGR